MTPHEPIAIVGIGCRMPGGAMNPESLWRLLCDGVDAISEVPKDRWLWPSVYHPEPGRPGKVYVRHGGFLEGVDFFDAQFFGISPREAAWADPQQRLLLEVAYEALEDAGLPMEAIAGSRTAVFVGISTYDYGVMQGRSDRRFHLDAYATLGSALCVSANRLSYFFDLQGPSLTVDTACSSSLVATHLACQSIWNGEATMALVGGVNVLLQPEGTIGFCQAKMLAPDGRCKSFDAAADGYVRAEGVGVVLLRPLSEAIKNNDPVYAVIRGTGANQDGRTAGITVPSEVAQEALLREVCSQAGIAPASVNYVEAHGTGTSVGDPIELRALGNALGHERPDGAHCLIGSIKSNIGHLEAASGIAGLIKAALCVRHGHIPPSLHFTTPNPSIPFEKLKLRVVQELTPWPKNGQELRIAGVNSFGFGGTNAHVVLTSHPVTAERSTQDEWSEGRALLIPLSARSSTALKALGRSYVARLDDGAQSKLELPDIAHTTALRRTHHGFRAALVAHSMSEFKERVSALAEDDANVDGVVPDAPTRLVFVFSGMGPQWWAMGRQLQADEPVFREAIAQCDHALRDHVSWSLLEELAKDELQSRISETYIAQPAIFAIQIALARLWDSWGVRGDATLGHSLGEVAAAHYAGILSLEDAIALVYHRSRLQQRTAGEGGMLFVAMPIADLESIVADHDGKVSIAAYNSPESATLTGDTEVLQKIADRLTADEVFNRILKVDVPYHSRAMDQLQGELIESLQALSPEAGKVKLISTVTGKPVRGDEMTAEYWWRSMRQPVRFRNAVETAIQEDHRIFLEISPHPVLSTSISECASKSGVEVVVLPSLRREEPERATLLTSIGRLYGMGFPVPWNRVNGKVGRFVSVPRYPWQRERFWQETERARRNRIGEQVHPLLGTRNDAARASWTTDLNDYSLAFLDDHQVDQHVVFPAAAYLEMALEAAHELLGKPPYVVEDLVLLKAMVLPKDARPITQLVVGERTSEFDIFSRAHADEGSWERHATGKLYRLDDGEVPDRRSVDEIHRRCTHEMTQADCYRQFEALGLRYGPRFQGITRLRTGSGEAIGRIQLPDDLAEHADEYAAHPSLVDSSFQVLMGALLSDVASGRLSGEGLFLPVSIARVVYRSRPPRQLWCHARLVRRSPRRVFGDLELLDDEGNVVVEIHGFVCQQIQRADTTLSQGLYQYRWERWVAGASTVVRRADDLPSPQEILKRLGAEGNGSFWRGNVAIAARAAETVDLARAYLFEAFNRLGWRPPVGERFSEKDIAVRLGIVPQHLKLLHRLFTTLAEDGYVRQSGQEWIVAREFSAPASRETWKTLWDHFPSDLAELTLMRRCGENLDAVMRGDLDGLDLIFPGGTATTVEHLYQDSPSYRNCNRVVQKTVAAALQRLPEGRDLRILEIGGGTGGMTTYVLPELPARRTTYVFTDIGAMLLSQAEQRFGRYPFVEFQTLDIEKDPINQGFGAHSFDLILASDVLHATTDLRTALSHVKRLLASDGLLVLLEGTLAPTPLWCTLVFGLLKGWWLFTDRELRGEDPWIASQAWRDLLTSCGFADATDLTEQLGADEAVHSVIAARGPVVAEPDKPSPAEMTSIEPGSWLVLSDDGGVGSDLAQGLRDRGHTVVNVLRGDCSGDSEDGSIRVRPSRKDEMQHVVAKALAASPKLLGVVHLWSLDLPTGAATDLASLETARTEVCASILHLVQCLADADTSQPPRLILVTRGAESVGAAQAEAAVSQAPLWGLGRVIMAEHPQLRCKLIDLDPDEDCAAALVIEALTDDAEEEVALRGEVRHVHRLTRVAPDMLAPLKEAGSRAGARSYHVAVPARGSLEDFPLLPTTRTAPEAGEIEIEIYASGLNFKDVMLALGLYPEDALEGGFTGRSLGMECAGRIVALGDGVEGLNVGDAVIACGPGTLRSHLTLNARLVAHMPPDLSFEEAATIPIAFLTAYYALHNLARLERGERVLIHAATGGVGLAAVQLAQRIGAEIFTTAGTDEKRELLKALGVPHVMNSRTLTFAEEVMERTNGEGVDVVLNSLAGDAIPKSLAVLRPYGRFVEIGKRDIYEDSKVGLRSFRNNLSLFVLDMDGLYAQRPDAAREVFDQVLKLVGNKALRPLPHRVFPVERISEAFRHMAQAKHIGKVVVSLRDASVRVAEPPPAKVEFQSDGTYLITGGLGGFGLALARWLARHGAGRLVLMSRRGAVDEKTQAAIDAIEADGACVTIVQGDVSRQEDVRNVLAKISESMPPLRGLFHAAMVLDDAPIQSLNGERLAKVMAPKVEGAWNLHLLTRELPLDYFVLFSSMASQMGNPGQANYAAANAFLDSLAHYRRARELPALTVNWGALADVGYVADNPDIAKRLEAYGVKPLAVEQMLSTLAMLLQRQAVQVSVGQFDWRRLTRAINVASSPRFADLVAEQGDDDLAGGGLFDLGALLQAEPAQRLEILEGRLRDQLARVLGTTAGRLDVNQSLMSLGVDSLMAVEIRNRIRAELGVDVPPAKFMEGISVRGMASFVLARLAELDERGAGGPSKIVTAELPASAVTLGKPETAPSEREVLETVSELSDKEVDVELRRLLAQTGGS
ncbi:MAG: SDR family NAD(P)-dependent oxidoreductase [Planctomycetes bacterium]|nr:SDR family NAD(P)-dependent oxidoreductase [Planctomycetota bacterium]